MKHISTAPLYEEILLYRDDSSIPIRGCMTRFSKLPYVPQQAPFFDISPYKKWLPLPDGAASEIDCDLADLESLHGELQESLAISQKMQQMQLSNHPSALPYQAQGGLFLLGIGASLFN